MTSSMFFWVRQLLPQFYRRLFWDHLASHMSHSEGHTFWMDNRRRIIIHNLKTQFYSSTNFNASWPDKTVFCPNGCFGFCISKHIVPRRWSPVASYCFSFPKVLISQVQLSNTRQEVVGYCGFIPIVAMFSWRFPSYNYCFLWSLKFEIFPISKGYYKFWLGRLQGQIAALSRCSYLAPKPREAAFDK